MGLNLALEIYSVTLILLKKQFGSFTVDYVFKGAVCILSYLRFYSGVNSLVLSSVCRVIYELA